MQMSTLKGWHGELLEEAPKGELKHLTQKGTVDGYHSHLQHTSCISLNTMINPTVNSPIEFQGPVFNLDFCDSQSQLRCYFPSKCVFNIKSNMN